MKANNKVVSLNQDRFSDHAIAEDTLPDFRCAICESFKAENLYTLNNAVLIDNNIEAYRLPHLLCQHCGCIQVYPQPERSAMMKYYAQTPFFNYKERKVRQLASHVFLRSNLDVGQFHAAYDIGAGDGYFLSLLPCVKKNGLEADQQLIGTARQNYGIELEHFSNDDGVYNLRDYRLVIMSHLLEHLFSPTESLLSIRKGMPDNGYLFIEVPSVEAFAKDSVNSEIMAFPHLYHFTNQSLDNLLIACGFSVHTSEVCKDDKFPVIRGIYQVDPKFSGLGSFDAVDISHTKIWFEKHLEHRQRKSETAINRLRAAVKTDAKVVIYGAGVDLYDLVFQYPDFPENVFVVDSNKDKVGKKIGHLVISSLESISKEDEKVSIFISSRLLSIQTSIRESIDEIVKKFNLNADISNLFN